MRQKAGRQLVPCFLTYWDTRLERGFFSEQALIGFRLKYFPDAVTADKAAEIIGYTKTTVISHIREKHISAVLISGKYIVPKTALVDFLPDDFAFKIVNKSPWHMNTILQFAEE